MHKSSRALQDELKPRQGAAAVVATNQPSLEPAPLSGAHPQIQSV